MCLVDGVEEDSLILRSGFAPFFFAIFALEVENDARGTTDDTFRGAEFRGTLKALASAVRIENVCILKVD